jgi:hypothetical protein
MALNIKIDFEARYKTDPVDNLNYTTFYSELQNGESTLLGIRISVEEHPLMMDVYNLSFGPVDEKRQIDDKAKLKHMDHSKVFSTIVFEGLSFLTQHPNKYIGIDGSNTARAYMYYRCIQNNFEYLSSYFIIYGVKYFVRVLRDNENDYDDDDFLTMPERIKKGESIKPSKLYNYFIFKMK